MPRLRFGFAALFAVSTLAAARPASANGQFPAAGQLVVDPGDATHLLLRTTFGLLTSRDAGMTWDWMCEAAVGYANWDPGLGITADGTAIAGLLNGVSVAQGDLCTWALAPGIDKFVPDVSVERMDPSRAVALTSQGGANISEVWESIDNAAHWAQAGVDLPGFISQSLDVAPSDTSRIYVTGLHSVAGSFVGALARSLDHGGAWTVVDIPGATPQSAAYIGGIDPIDADKVYVRLAGTPGNLLVTSNAGDSWSKVFTSMGYLRSFALSPDGSKVLVGGESDGLWRASSASLQFQQVSAVGARCLTWADAGVYACGNDATDGFTVGLSIDEGTSFAPLLTLACVRGPLACAAGSSVATSCPAVWPMVSAQIGVMDCSGAGGAAGVGAGGAAGTSSSAAGTGGASSTGSGQASAGPGPGASAAQGNGSTTGAGSGAGGGGSSSGGGCGIADGDGRGAASMIAALALIVGARRRRWHARQDSNL